MSMALLAPLGLAALLALLVPLVIHLIRRPQHEIIDFAALRWVGERMRPRRRLQFDDLWLLIVRLLLIAAIALLLASPVLDRDWRGAREWVVVAPGIEAAQAHGAATGVAADAQWRWLSPGFPSIDSGRVDANVETASLLRELDATLDGRDRMVVVVPALLDGLDGEPIVLARKVDWRIVDEAVVDSELPVPAPIRVAVRYPADAAPALRYLRAMIAAWNAPVPDHYVADLQTIDAPLADGTDWLIWLGGTWPPAIDAWIAAGGTVLSPATEPPTDAIPVWRNGHGATIATAQRQGAGHRITFLHEFNPASFAPILDGDFPERMRELLVGAELAPARADASSVTPSVEPSRAAAPVFPLDDIVIVLIVLLFLLERWLATRRRSFA